MKFECGDETDQALTTTLVHEFVLCQESFERFARNAKVNIMGQRDKIIKIKCHDAYASFLHHLYEFCVGCMKRDLKDTKDMGWENLDKMFNSEARRLLRNRIDAIENGYAPSWENHISVYQVEVDEEFGAQFRKIRNRTAHVSTKRSMPGNDLPLAVFYQKYHRFVYLLYYSARGFWSVQDIESHDWKAIEDFDLAVNG